MSGTLLRNLSAHAHLAVLGWITLAICAVSYRFMTALISDHEQVPRSAMVQIFALAAATIALFIALIAGVGNVTVWTVLVAVTLASYAFIFQRILGSRSLAADWTKCHALAAVFCLLLAVAGRNYAGANRCRQPLPCASGLRIRRAGIAGMGEQFYRRHVLSALRRVRGASANRSGLASHEPRGTVGQRRTIAGFLRVERRSADNGWRTACRPNRNRAGGSIFDRLGGIVYSAAMGWTLSFAYRRAAPRPQIACCTRHRIEPAHLIRGEPRISLSEVVRNRR